MRSSTVFFVALFSFTNFIAAETSAAVVSQIGDGQIQATTETTAATTAAAVSQIGDGQIQATTETSSAATTAATTAAAVSQISDGQIQATSSTGSVWVKTESGNAAGKITVGAGAGLAAVAALLL
ncbi:unnamed protein product [Kluyveromyces dobzhanskii CBS 2104]|uniref:WGS project CCBQ000000000 data, contig 00016 n=1 Tax=Kluyveromyces dobzhanskii CBS 2104 TaxID=1427455 RepID=A0A0A8L0C3_9SACH|nr:unnamed protein product [Kluyveromyces dobzhanskii CBS 2104]